MEEQTIHRNDRQRLANLPRRPLNLPKRQPNPKPNSLMEISTSNKRTDIKKSLKSLILKAKTHPNASLNCRIRLQRHDSNSSNWRRKNNGVFTPYIKLHLTIGENYGFEWGSRTICDDFGSFEVVGRTDLRGV